MKQWKKVVGLALAAVMTFSLIAACDKGEPKDSDTGKDTAKVSDSAKVDESEETTEAAEDTTAPADSEEETSEPAESEVETSESEDANTEGLTGKINVYSRDDASGTREAFSDIIGLDEDAGELTSEAVITSGNGDQATKVGQDPLGIGYVALTTDFEGSNIVPVSYNGVTPSAETVIDGTYELYRPFSYVTRAEDDFATDEEKQLIAAFIAFLTESKEGLEAVESEGGIVDVESAKPWDEIKADHPIVDQDNSAINIKTGGSTSVQKTLDAAISAFKPLAGNVNITTDQTGSSDGYKRVLGEEKDGPSASHIGFASREFKGGDDPEAGHTDGMAYGHYAKDAVVVVVEKANDLDNITTEQILKIYKGEITNWEDLG